MVTFVVVALRIFSEFKNFTLYPTRDQNTGRRHDSAIKSSQSKGEQNSLTVLCVSFLSNSSF